MLGLNDTLGYAVIIGFIEGVLDGFLEGILVGVDVGELGAIVERIVGEYV